MKNPLFEMKSVIKGKHKAKVGAGAETKSFGSTTLHTGTVYLQYVPVPYHLGEKMRRRWVGLLSLPYCRTCLYAAFLISLSLKKTRF
jgi:hypothetical protein